MGFYHVLYPKEKKSLLKEWDLWGPMINLEHKVTGRQYLILPISVCASLLPSSTRPLSGAVSNHPDPLPDHLPSVPQMSGHPCRFWLVDICIHAVSGRLYRTCKACPGSLSHVPFLPRHWVDGDITLSRLNQSLGWMGNQSIRTSVFLSNI